MSQLYFLNGLVDKGAYGLRDGKRLPSLMDTCKCRGVTSEVPTLRKGEKIKQGMDLGRNIKKYSPTKEIY